jgi:hypothetical protein
LRPLPIRDPALGSRGTVLAAGWLRFAEIEAVTGHAECGEVLPWVAANALFPEAEATLARLVAPRLGLQGETLVRPVVVARDVDAEAGTRAIWRDAPRASAGLPAICRADLPSAAQAAGASVWAPESWRALETAGLQPGLRVLTPAPVSVADAAALRRVFDTLATRLDGLEAAGLPRERIIVGLGAPALPAYSALGLLHGLGCPLLIDVDAADRGEAVCAAAGVVAAAQGIQFIATRRPAAVAAAIEGWMLATGEGVT